MMIVSDIKSAQFTVIVISCDLIIMIIILPCIYCLITGERC